MSEFTFGKWECDKLGYIYADKVAIAKALGNPNAVVGDDRKLRIGESTLSPVYAKTVLGYSREEWLKELNANARLMAAAPEMYNLLHIWTQLQSQSAQNLMQKKARELLARLEVEENGDA